MRDVRPSRQRPVQQMRGQDVCGVRGRFWRVQIMCRGRAPVGTTPFNRCVINAYQVPTKFLQIIGNVFYYRMPLELELDVDVGA